MVLENTKPSSKGGLKIDLQNPESVSYWAQVFGLDELDLMMAVRTAGRRPQDVALLLRKPWR
ncbi:DUF3606 domain-containing protein [Muricoccus aerilatus]|uniref:DUF3606 domain-containing protein n=1 Tax=Muricoccus aerilatus TaxID=452982 RepID=UPI0005C155D8|nr:DUF3606 domain-containing protein [Roseomonas aerilata]